MIYNRKKTIVQSEKEIVQSEKEIVQGIKTIVQGAKIRIIQKTLTKLCKMHIIQKIGLGGLGEFQK